MALIDFPAAPTVGQEFLAPNAATYRWDGEVWTAPLVPTSGGGGSANPIGPAGGDLTGSYPNPLIGPLKVTNAKINDVAWAKITGVPGVNISKWREAGSLLMPLDPSRTITAAPVSNAFQWGGMVSAILSRMADWGEGAFEWRVNVRASEPQNLDDPLSPAWAVAVNALEDAFRVHRTPPGATASWTRLLQVDSIGDLSVSGQTFWLSQRASLESDSHAVNLWGNANGQPGYLPALHTWGAVLDYETDRFDVTRDGVSLLNVRPDGRIRVTVDPQHVLDLVTKQYVDGVSKWSIAGSTLTPTDATKNLTIVGTEPGSGISIEPVNNRAYLRLGTPVGERGRVGHHAGVTLLTQNTYFDGSSWIRDDPSKVAWGMGLQGTASDQVVWQRWDAAGTLTFPLTLRSDGRLTLGADPTAALDATTKQYVDTRAVPPGGVTQQILAKSGPGDYATGWVINPNGSGLTVAGDLSGTLPTPQIAAGVIVDADVNAAANIVGTKLLAKSVDGLRMTKAVYGRLYRTAVLNLPSTVTTYLTFAGIAANYTASAGCSWSGAQPTRLTCAEAGLYAVGAAWSYAGVASMVHALLYKNSSLIITGISTPSPGYQSMFALCEVNANEFFEVTFLPNAAITIDSTYLAAGLWAVRIG